MAIDLLYIESTSGFLKNFRTQLNNYYSNLPEEIKVDVLKTQWDLLRKNNNKKIHGKEAEFYYTMFLIAINELRLLETIPSRKTAKVSQEELEKIHAIRCGRIKSNKKLRPNKNKYLIEVRFFDLIAKLRGEDMSWRDISQFLALYHKTKISHTHLSVIYKQIVAEREI